MIHYLHIRSIKMMINVKELKKQLDYNVIQDIKEFKKPAFVYYYHYKINQMNAIDTEEMWKQEYDNLIKQGVTPKQEKRQVKFGIKKWDCILWVFRPLDENGNVDEKKFSELVGLIQDPLAMSIGYMVSGYCYLQLVKMVK